MRDQATVRRAARARLARFDAWSVPPDGDGPGAPVSVRRIGWLPHPLIRFLFRRRGVAAAMPTERGVTLRRLVYRTRAPDGRVVDASGLLGLPRGRAPLRGVVSWQHGTTSLRSQAPSGRDVMNGLLPAAAFAGHGYVLLAPDYLGFGISEEPHEYYLADHIAGVVRDFVVASWCVLTHNGVAPPPRLYLAGFSEGGHASLAAQRLIEREPVPGLTLTAVAPVSAAVDLAGAGLEGALAGGSRYCSMYLAWLAKSYAEHYREPIADVLRPEWAATVAELFDGRHDGDTTVAALPSDPRAMLADSFLRAHELGAAHWFTDRLAENSLLDWRPRVPIRTYYGTRDADVTPAQATITEDHLGRDGVDVRAVCVGDIDHEGTIERAAPLLRDWLDALGADLTRS